MEHSFEVRFKSTVTDWILVSGSTIIFGEMKHRHASLKVVRAGTRCQSCVRN